MLRTVSSCVGYLTLLSRWWQCLFGSRSTELYDVNGRAFEDTTVRPCLLSSGPSLSKAVPRLVIVLLGAR